jgi:elongation of very long chain fatty acids protein 6
MGKPQVQTVPVLLEQLGFNTAFRHPSFWPGIAHNEGDYGFYFDFEKHAAKGQVIPWEMTQLNATEDNVFDYTYIELDDPPQFIPYSFEIFDWKWWVTFATKNWQFPFIAGIVYLTAIFGIQHWMRNRPAYKLKWPLFLWNAGLGIFSIMGFIRTAPEFFHVMTGIGLYKGICYRLCGNWPFSYWSFLFVFSKYAELGDTIFIVLRKRPLVFIQWYHHLVTMAMCWLTAPYIEPISRWYIVMNFAVHSMMYPYFALTVLGVKVPRRISVTITTCQLSQMLIGLIVNLSSALLIRFGVPCYRHPFSVKMSFLVYGSFTFLFAKLFYDVVTDNKSKAKKSKAE